MPGLGKMASDSIYEIVTLSTGSDTVKTKVTGLPFITLMVSALAGGTVYVQVSADGVIFVNDGIAVAAVGAVTVKPCSFLRVIAAGGAPTITALCYATRGGE